VLLSGCGFDHGISVTWQGESESTVGVVFDDQEALRLAYQSCQNDPFQEAPPAPGQPEGEVIEETNASPIAVAGKARSFTAGFTLQSTIEPDPTALRDFGTEGKDIALFTTEQSQVVLSISTQRAKLAARAAALDPYWQPLATAHSIEEGGNRIGLDDLIARKASNGQDGGQWPFQRYGDYWESRDVPLIRQTINTYCRQSATRMEIDF
jgi:hypothetical protein